MIYTDWQPTDADINRLLVDLDARQLRWLIQWLWVNSYPADRASVKGWRKMHYLPKLD